MLSVRPPRRKVWKTRGRPNLLVVGAYRMGFEISALGRASRLRVIDYDYPATIAAKVLGSMFGPIYARCCVNRMANDATNAFEGSVQSYIGGA